MGFGWQLAQAFFEEEVRPVLRRGPSRVGYLAGRLGSGSDVLGFDDERSTDHDFGCRLTLLVDDAHAGLVAALDELLEAELPQHFQGRPVRFATTWDERVRHRVHVSTVHRFAESRLGVDVTGWLGPGDWLSLTGQSVLEVVGGRIFHDGTTEYGRLVERLGWYPTDLWLYVLAASWTRLSQELPFVGRTAERGDDLGSRLITARLAKDVVHLAFLLERRWPPYPKWAGSALRALPSGPDVTAHLADATAAEDWRRREDALCAAIEVLGGRQRQLGLPIASPVVEAFYDRPFRITNPQTQHRLMQAVGDPEIRVLPVGVGSIEQWCDNVDLLSRPERRPAVQALYRQLLPAT